MARAGIARVFTTDDTGDQRRRHPPAAWPSSARKSAPKAAFGHRRGVGAPLAVNPGWVYQGVQLNAFRHVASPRASVTWTFLILVALAAMIPAASCVQAQPPVDTGADPVTTSTTASTTASSSPGTAPAPAAPTTALSYDQDLKPVFNSDCVVCHSGSRPSANYSMTSYAAVMRDAVPGSASSRLVVWTQPTGTMYRYFTGDRASKAAMVRSWVVDDKAAQSR